MAAAAARLRAVRAEEGHELVLIDPLLAAAAMVWRQPDNRGDQTVAVLTRSPLASTRSKSRQIVASDTVALAWPPRPPTRPLLLPPRAPSLPVVRSA